ncbi:MAG: L-2-hydroxyglutarate oxidase [Thermoanaerobaculia bacterium]
MARRDIVVVGGGIVGLATAMALAEDASVVVLEAEDDVARHQSGHNSGVIHSGLYYPPGSLKAELCASGRQALERLCEEDGIPFERRGKLVVATREEEIPALDELERRGRANGLAGIERLDGQGIREHEPQAAGLAGLLVAETGIVDYVAVCRAYAARVRRAGGEIRTGSRLLSVREKNGEAVLVTAAGEIHCRCWVNCAGLQSDRVARLSGIEPEVRIIPFRGEYCEVVGESRNLVQRPIYPVPDPRFPFLDVHLTPTLDGRLEAGPNAILALKREGYRRTSFSLRDTLDTLAYPGFWRLAGRFWRTGVDEVVRSLVKRRFVAALRRLVPAIRTEDVRRAGSGVRAQAVDRQGGLVDDFRIVEAKRSVHVLNAPSPGATASIAIGRHIAERVTARL